MLRLLSLMLVVLVAIGSTGCKKSNFLRRGAKDQLIIGADDPAIRIRTINDTLGDGDEINIDGKGKNELVLSFQSNGSPTHSSSSLSVSSISDDFRFGGELFNDSVFTYRDTVTGAPTYPSTYIMIYEGCDLPVENVEFVRNMERLNMIFEENDTLTSNHSFEYERATLFRSSTIGWEFRFRFEDGYSVTDERVDCAFYPTTDVPFYLGFKMKDKRLGWIHCTLTSSSELVIHEIAC